MSTIAVPQPGFINVYDSMHLKATNSLKTIIANMTFSDKKAISKRNVHIQQQIGGSDCGLFAIANAIAVCHRKDLGTLLFNKKGNEEHLRKCFVAEILKVPL